MHFAKRLYVIERHLHIRNKFLFLYCELNIVSIAHLTFLMLKYAGYAILYSPFFWYFCAC